MPGPELIQQLIGIAALMVAVGIILLVIIPALFQRAHNSELARLANKYAAEERDQRRIRRPMPNTVRPRVPLRPSRLVSAKPSPDFIVCLDGTVIPRGL